jgi:hypothetical protein
MVLGRFDVFPLPVNRFFQPKDDNHRAPREPQRKKKVKGYGWFETVKSFFKGLFLSKLKSMK